MISHHFAHFCLHQRLSLIARGPAANRKMICRQPLESRASRHFKTARIVEIGSGNAELHCLENFRLRRPPGPDLGPPLGPGVAHWNLGVRHRSDQGLRGLRPGRDGPAPAWEVHRGCIQAIPTIGGGPGLLEMSGNAWIFFATWIFFSFDP